MNVVYSNDNYQIYGESVKTYQKLPAKTYEVCFNKYSGFFLIEHSQLTVNEDKIYGNHITRIQKAMNSFKLSERNFGIILSGPKGVGKSLFARLLANEGVKNDIPLIIVSNYIPGISNFISSIQQEVIVLFDEFEKTFAEGDGIRPQEEMLSLFDGIDSGKKMFVITCNEVNRLNKFLINRPGRFHYHFIIGNPTADEITEYLNDKLDEQYKSVIPQVINFSMIADVTYDVLRAMAFEFNQGYSFEDTLMDLNISKEGNPRYKIRVTFADGEMVTISDKIDLYSSHEDYFWLHPTFNNKQYAFQIRFVPLKIKFDIETGFMVLDPNEAQYRFDEDDFEDCPEFREAVKARKVVRIEFIREMPAYNSSKYTV